VVDGEGFEPRLSCREFDMAETIREQKGLPFYLSENTFDSIPIPTRFVSVSVAIVGKDAREARCIID